MTLVEETKHQQETTTTKLEFNIDQKMDALERIQRVMKQHRGDRTATVNAEMLMVEMLGKLELIDHLEKEKRREQENLFLLLDKLEEEYSTQDN